MLTARLFGELELTVDGRPVPPIPGLKPRAVLAFLLLHPGRHPRAGLAARFWPDVLDTSARASLRSALWAVRSALETVGGERYLEAGRTTVAIAPELPREVDAERFEALVSAGERDGLTRAVELVRGPLVADLTEEWALEAQDRVRDQVAGALVALADAADAAGDPAGAIAFSRQAVRADRLRESSHRALMRRLAAAGEVAQAAAAYRRCQAILAHEFGVAPAPETRALAASLRAGSPEPAPAATGPALRPPRAAARSLGRAAERTALAAAWATAADGGGGVAVVRGAAGIGKTSLVADLAGEAAAAGAAVAEGAAIDVGGPPLAPWSEVARALVRVVAPPPAAYRWPADLARLCPAAEQAWNRPAAAPGPPDVERGRLGEALVETVAWAARERPVLLVLEDLHAADAASLAFLAYVGRRLRGERALVLVTARPGNAGLDVVLDGLRGRDAVLCELALGPLGDEAVAGIVRRMAPSLDAAAVDEVVGVAGGNPLLAREAARARAAGHDASRGLESWLRGRLAGLDGSTRLLVDLVAVAGRPLTPGEAADLVGAEALAGGLDAAAAAGLLVERPDRRVAFVHELVREAAVAALPPGRRVWAHDRLAEALGRRAGRQPAEIARHLRAAGRDRPAFAQLVAAASSARALGALDEAAGFLQQAVELAPDDASAAEALIDLAEAHAWRGDGPAFEAAFEQGCTRIAAAGNGPALATVWLRRGHWLLTIVCDPSASLRAFERADEVIGRLPAVDPELQALLVVGRGWAAVGAGAPADAPEVRAALEWTPDPEHDPGLAAAHVWTLALLELMAGRFAESEAPCAEAERLARLAGATTIAQVAPLTRAVAAAGSGDFERALAIADAAVRPGEAAATLVVAQLQATRAHLLSRMGRHAEARAAAAAQLEAAARADATGREEQAAFDAGMVALAAGDADAATGFLEAALAGNARLVRRPLGRLLLAEAQLLRGDVDAAAAELDRVPFEPVRPADVPDTLVARMSRLQGLVAEARGDSALALRRLAEAEVVWRRRLGGPVVDDAYRATIADLGRVPVGGMVEPPVELGRVLAERARVLAATGAAAEAQVAATEAAALAAAARFDGYRAVLDALRSPMLREV